MTQDYYKAETTKRYDIPLTHLDYSYIKDCTDVKELEKILRVLRSGDEGHYPDLEKETEKRLEQLNPKSRILRKDNPVLKASDLDIDEQDHLKHELETWKSDMEDREQMLSTTTVSKKGGAEDLAFEEDASLPPVRSGKVMSVDGKIKDADPANVKEGKKKVMPRSYKEWDKFDIDKELEKAEEDTAPKKTEHQASTFKPDGIASKIDTQGMSNAEKRAKAVREKDKGNEAFHAHDYEESILYYTRSISIAPLSATYNNRALAYLRLSKWNDAINDCNYVLKEEPENIKALLRRGTALKGKQDFAEARADLDTVLSMESNNKTAQDLLKEISKLEDKASTEAVERKEKGRRMVIEEVDGSDEDEDFEDVSEEIIVEKPDSERKPNTLVNGYAEKTESAEPSVPSSDSTETRPTNQEEKSYDEVPPSEASSVEVAEDKDSKTREDTFVGKDVCAEEEVQSKTTELSSAGQKPKLVATNIVSDQCNIPNDSVTNARPEKEISASIGSGDSIQTKSDFTAKDNIVSGEKPELTSSAIGADSTQKELDGDDEKVPEDVDRKHEESDENVEAELQHARPVLVQTPFPSSEAALREKGNNLFRTGQYPEAIEVYQKIISKLEKDPKQVVNLSLIYSNRAACYLKIGDCQSAISDCVTSLDLVPHSVKPLLRRAAAYETLEKYRQAYVDYKHILSVDSTVDQAHQGASRCQGYLTNQYGPKWREKLPALVRVSQWDVPEIVDESSVGKKSAEMPSNKTTSTKEEPSETRQQKQEDKTHSIRKQVPDTQPKKQEPAEEVPKKKEKVPSPEEQFETTKAQGNKHVAKGEFEAAVKCYCQCVKLFPDRAAVFTNRALCYLRLNKAHEAEDDCTTALALEPNNSKAFYRRALARKAQKHYKDSLQDLLQLLRLEPSNSVAKKEMEVVKGLYKEEYDQLKAHPVTTGKKKESEKEKKKTSESEKKKAPEPEKKRKRMKIEEVDDDSDAEEKDSQPQPPSTSKTKASGTTQKTHSPSATPVHSGNVQKPTTSPSAQPSPAPDSKHANSRTPESRKPGRGKSKKGGVKETSVGLPVTPPSAPKLQGKITPFEFIQHWNSLKQAKEIQPYVQLLEQISPDDLPGVISNKLDGHMLQIITRCAAHDAQTGEVERAYSILRNIRQVPRFSTVVMFLSNKEKQDIRKVLESTISLGTRADEVAAVKKDYGLK